MQNNQPPPNNSAPPRPPFNPAQRPPMPQNPSNPSMAGRPPMPRPPMPVARPPTGSSGSAPLARPPIAAPGSNPIARPPIAAPGSIPLTRPPMPANPSAAPVQAGPSVNRPPMPQMRPPMPRAPPSQMPLQSPPIQGQIPQMPRPPMPSAQSPTASAPRPPLPRPPMANGPIPTGPILAGGPIPTGPLPGVRPPIPSGPSPQAAPMRPQIPAQPPMMRPPMSAPGQPQAQPPMRPPVPGQPPLTAPLRPPVPQSPPIQAAPLRPPMPSAGQQLSARPPLQATGPQMPPPASPLMAPRPPMSPAPMGPSSINQLGMQQPQLTQPMQPQIPQMGMQQPLMPQMTQPIHSQIPQMSQPIQSQMPQMGQPMQSQIGQQIQYQYQQKDAPVAVNSGSHNLESLTTPAPFSHQPNIDPAFFRCSIGKIPRTSALLSKGRLPFGVSVTFYPFGDVNADKVPEINGPIVRCKRCRTYLNPFVEMLDMGARWRCNLCFFANEFPQNYDYDPVRQAAMDRSQHPELNTYVYDFASAGTEYTARPPQPPVFLFALDVTATAVQSGMFAVACRVIQEQLDVIPNADGRTRIGFIAYDQSLHFFKIPADPAEKTRILVAADPSEAFLPAANDLLVNLSECRAQIDALLEQLPSLYAAPSKASPSLGPMLNAAHLLMKPYGGKIVTFLSNLPTAYAGALKARDDPAALGTPKESGLLQPANQFYKLFATEVVKDQICVDLFVAPPKTVNYVDLATIGGLSKYTGGKIHYYPGFGSSQTDAEAVKFASDLRRFLAQEHGYEAVLRIRASKGLSLSAYHGSFFMRYSDLLCVPNVNPDHSFAAQVTIDENLVGSTVFFQGALLHTTCTGERRIRVVNFAAPITDDIKDYFASLDVCGIAAILPHMACEKILSNRLEDAREAVLHKCADVLGAYKAALGLKTNPNLLLPANLANYAIFMHGLMKSVAMRAGRAVSLDMRAYMLALIKTLSPTEITNLLVPRFYAMHSMDSECGLEDENGKVKMPPLLNLTSERLERHGIFLLDCHFAQLIWVGSTVHPELISLLFGEAGVPAGGRHPQLLPEIDNDWSRRVRAICQQLRNLAHRQPAEYYIIREDSEPAIKYQFTQFLIEDRINEATPSYAQWLSEVAAKVNSGSY